MRRALGIVAAVVLLATLNTPPAMGASEPEARYHFEVVRTTTSASSFELTVDMSPPSGSDLDAYTAAVGFRTGETGAVESVVGLGATALGATNEPGVFYDGTAVTTCTAAGVCNAQPTFAAVTLVGHKDNGEADALNRYYVVVEGKVALSDIRFEAKGWVLAETSLETRYSDLRDAEGAAVTATPSVSANAFLSTQLAGGASGSLAMAAPPCSQATSGVVARGAGRMTLSGGTEDQVQMCPFVGGNGVLADHAPAATTWEASGLVAGDSTLHEGRLFVVDLPGCERLIPGVVGASDEPC